MPNTAAKAQVVLLAAGRSQRFGPADKRFATLAGGGRVWERSLQVYRACDLPVILVVGRGETELFRNRDPNLQIIESALSPLGMGHSIASGVAASTAPFVLIALADMPYIQSASVERILESAESGGIVVPSYLGQAGHPRLFSREFIPELQRLQGDSGAKSLLAERANSVTQLALDDPAIVRDIDIPADLAAH